MNMAQHPKRNHCFYHDERSSFADALPILKRIVSIPRSLWPRVAMAVCSCRKKTCNRTAIAELNQIDKDEPLSDSQLLRELLNRLKVEDNTAACTTKAFVSSIVSEKTSDNESATRFVVLLKMALRKSFQFLLEENSSKNTVSLNALDPSGKGSTNGFCQRIPAKVYRSRARPYILKKRKRQADGMFLCTLPIFGGELRRLYDEKDVGELFRTFSIKYRPCVIELDYNETGERMRQNRKETVIKIWCKRHDLFSISHTLQSKALDAQAVNDQAHKFRVRRHNHGRVYSYEPSRQFIDDLLDVKKDRQNQYQRKHVMQNKSSPNMRNKKKSVQVTTKKDKGSSKVHNCKKSVKCYNCQCERDTVPHRYTDAKGQDRSQACIYHPGFISTRDNENVWTCCGRSVDASQTAERQHNENGCVQGPHLWRYQTKKFSVSDGWFSANSYSNYMHIKNYVIR